MDRVSFPLETAAERLGVTRRWLMEWLRKHPWDAHGTPFYRCAGKTKLFTPGDVARIHAALPGPEGAPCSVSTHRAKASRRTGASAAPISESAWIKAAELTGDRSLLPSSMRSPEKSSAKSGKLRLVKTTVS
jgi:hypothetical protein